MTDYWFESCSTVVQWMTSMWWRHGSNPIPATNISSSWQMGQANSPRHWTWCLTSARRVWATAPEDTLSLSTTSRWRWPTSKKAAHSASPEETTSLRLWRLRKVPSLPICRYARRWIFWWSLTWKKAESRMPSRPISLLLLCSGASPFLCINF